MDRRGFLSGAAALTAVAVAPQTVRTASAAPNARLIDAHCHLFNAEDLPIVGFVEKVVITEHPDFQNAFKKYGHAADFFVRFLSDWMRGKAFSAGEELEHLDDPAKARSAAKIRSDEIAALTDLVERMRTLRVRGQNWTLGERIYGFYVPGVVIGLMHREAFPGRFNGQGVSDNSDGAFTPSEWQESGFLAQQVYDHGRGQVSRYVRWAMQLTRYRSELADELGRIHGGKAVLATPALIDYSKWLKDEFDVKLADQVKVMGKIARRAGNLRVHPFAPFDPLREALRRIDGHGASWLALAQNAVKEEGFIGVKLYPPMGFLPFGNARLPNSSFHAHLQRPFRGRRIGRDLDSVLRELYAWCVAEQVPVLAHASDSNGSAPGMSGRANPENWAAVLKEFPTLRLSLAHFGDFDEGFRSEKRRNPKLTDTWEWKMAKLVQDHAASPVFLDISYFRGAILKREHGTRREILRMFGEVKRAMPLAAKRLMFGSDWIMLGQEENFLPVAAGGRYADRVAEMLSEIGFTGPEIDAVMYKNASSFLGLDKVDPVGNHARLKNFYAANGLPAGWLDQLVS